MRKLLILIAVLFWPHPVKAQVYPNQFEQLCPGSTVPIGQDSTWNPSTQRWKANWCIDANGNLTIITSGALNATGTFSANTLAMTLEQFGGGPSASAATNTTAWNSVMASLVAISGGGFNAPASGITGALHIGTGIYSLNAVTIPAAIRHLVLFGNGKFISQLKFTASSGCLIASDTPTAGTDTTILAVEMSEVGILSTGGGTATGLCMDGIWASDIHDNFFQNPATAISACTTTSRVSYNNIIRENRFESTSVAGIGTVFNFGVASLPTLSCAKHNIYHNTAVGSGAGTITQIMELQGGVSSNTIQDNDFEVCSIGIQQDGPTNGAVGSPNNNHYINNYIDCPNGASQRFNFNSGIGTHLEMAGHGGGRGTINCLTCTNNPNFTLIEDPYNSNFAIDNIGNGGVGGSFSSNLSTGQGVKLTRDGGTGGGTISPTANISGTNRALSLTDSSGNTRFYIRGDGVVVLNGNALNNTDGSISALTSTSWSNVADPGTLTGQSTAYSDLGALQLKEHPNANVIGQIIRITNGFTTQKSETAADTNVLTVTPVAQAGTYKLRFVMSVSAANAATLGWTATWTDSNGNAQTPANLALSQTGVAAPALTFTTSAAGNYFGDANIDINNAATSIVIKLTFSGTSFTAKVSASVERVM